jgi:hypothetical protein
MYKISTAEDIISLIEQIELKFQPQSWKYKGIDIWPIFRITLYYDLSLSITENDFNLKSISSKKIHRIVNSFISSTNSISEEASILFVSDGISYVNMGGKLYEKFCDPIIEILERHEKSWIKWDLTGDLKGDRKYKSCKIEGALDFRFLLSQVFPLGVNLNGLDSIMNELFDFVAKETENRVLWTVVKWKPRLKFIHSIVKWFSLKLRQLKPEHVLIVSYYNERAMAIIKACHDLGIRTADIQHGMQGSLHAAYGNWLNVPANGYNTLPDDFFVWSENEKNGLEKWTSDTLNKIIIGGNLFEEKWYEHKDEMVKKSDDLVEKMVKKMKASKTILFTLQYGIVYQEDIWEFIKNTQEEFNWLIRLHPVMEASKIKKKMVDRFKKMNIYNFEIELSSSLPLYSVLRCINAHVTHSSSSILEAINFGQKTLLIDYFGYENYIDQVSLGHAFFSSDNTERLLILRKILNEQYKNMTERKNSSSSNIILNYFGN